MLWSKKVVRQFNIEQVKNGYIVTSDFCSMMETHVYTSFDKMVNDMALHFDVTKIGEKYIGDAL